MPRSFGIDFGTTNTRIAFYDGQRALMVPFTDREGLRTHQILTVVGYRNGIAAAFGADAYRGDYDTPKASLKWLAAEDTPVTIGREQKLPEDIICDFIKHLRAVVRKELVRKEMNAVNITVPVRYPYRARQVLLRGIRKAGIDVEHVYQEPVAALYCYMEARRTPGVAGVFDWGGGTLDVAIVRVDAGWAQVLDVDGLRKGGEDFDRTIVDAALTDFLRGNLDLSISCDQIVRRVGHSLRLGAELVKIRLSQETTGRVLYRNLLPGRHLEYEVSREAFQSWIKYDIQSAIACLQNSARRARVDDGFLNPLLLSGGTSHVPAVQLAVRNAFGPGHVVAVLPGQEGLPLGAPERDVANATAIGAAMLGMWNAQPVFAKEIGIRTADAESTSDHFLPIFQRGDIINGHTVAASLFVSDASTGVARILICDRLEPDIDPAGRLLRVLTIPIDRREKWVNVSLSMDHHLVLKISASGRIAAANSQENACDIPNVAVGYAVPQPEAANKSQEE